MVAQIQMVDGQALYRLRHSWGALTLAWHSADQLRPAEKPAGSRATEAKPKTVAKPKSSAKPALRAKAKPKT
ncbi:MAG: hypothetical protein ACRYG5_03775 [Janthinobacterium lividum]